MQKRYLMLLVFLISQLSYASPVIECKTYSFLKKGFSLENYQKCVRLFKACPMDGPVVNLDCVKKTIKKNRICQQTNQLANAIQALPATIDITAFDTFFLVDQLFIADGQHSYYLITPKNCLINTKIDPRNLDSELEKKYKNIPFMIVNWDKPKIKNINGSHEVETQLKITKTCLACEVIGYAKVRYEFDPAGKLHNVSLLSFSDQE